MKDLAFSRGGVSATGGGAKVGPSVEPSRARGSGCNVAMSTGRRVVRPRPLSADVNSLNPVKSNRQLNQNSDSDFMIDLSYAYK